MATPADALGPVERLREALGGRPPHGLVAAYLFGSAADEHAFRRDVQLRAADLEPFINRMRRLMVESLSR